MRKIVFLERPLPHLAASAALAAVALTLAACGSKSDMVAADAHDGLPADAVAAVTAEGGEAFGLPPTSAAQKSAPLPSSL